MSDLRAFLREMFPPVLAWGRVYGRETVNAGRFHIMSPNAGMECEGYAFGMSARLRQAVMVLMP